MKAQEIVARGRRNIRIYAAWMLGLLFAAGLALAGCPGVQTALDCARDADGKIH